MTSLHHEKSQFTFQLLCLGILQSEKGGAPGYKCSSFAGASGPGYEPKPANIPGPGCRRDPGEASWVHEHLLEEVIN